MPNTKSGIKNKIRIIVTSIFSDSDKPEQTPPELHHLLNDKVKILDLYKP